MQRKMKNISSYLITEKQADPFDVMHIILNGSGSMNDGNIKRNLAKLVKQYPNAKLYQYYEDDSIVELGDLSEFKPSGPHSNSYKGLADFYKKHMGQLIMFIQN